MNIIWEKIKDCLKENLSTPGYQTFLSSTTPISLEDNILNIEVLNEFSKEWIKDKCEPVLKNKLKEITDVYLINYTIKKAQDPPKTEEQLSIFVPQKKASENQTTFNPKYTFNNFIVGHNNRFAYASSEAVAKVPAKTYNPLFIYGTVGLGKTHLLHAIGLKIQEKNPELITTLVSSEKFFTPYL